ncbi:hypothetical protein ACFX2H_013043 [Malus domestica]
MGPGFPELIPGSNVVKVQDADVDLLESDPELVPMGAPESDPAHTNTLEFMQLSWVLDHHWRRVLGDD